MPECYKVLRRVPGCDGGVSVFMDGEGLKTTYPPNVQVTARIGGFLVFEKLSQAVEFVEQNNDIALDIWRALGEEELPLPVVRLRLNFFYVLGFLKTATLLWAGAWHNARCEAWPLGTRAFRKVTCLEMVAWEGR